MYNDGVITTEFTGYVSDGEYISPSAKQTATIVFNGWYLSSEDLTTDGLTISSETGNSEDITIGNAPAKVLTATMLNPNGSMEGLTWGEGAVYIGVETASATADTYASLPVHVLVGSTHYGINSSGNARRGSTVYTLGGTPVAVISNADGTDVLFITDTSIGQYNGSFSVVSSPSAAQTFLAEKYRALTDPVGVVLDANGCPSVVNDVTNNTRTTTTNVPMGVFDFSGVDAFGITFGVEAYDRMTLFDADATDWVASLDFTTSKTLSTILSELMTEMGFSGNYTVSASAVNTTLTYSENPITAYAVTYRQILRWIAEAMGCSARMSRTGGVELWAWDSTSQETITPYTIISNTRTKARYTVPQITEVVCYDTLGMNYASGSEGVPYYIAANPFLTGLDTSVAPLTNICTLLRGIPVYYPSVIGQMYADPRLDTGDFVTLQTTDGTTPYVVPVMRQTLHWGGVCEATLVASGNQQRAVPSDLIDNNLATTVNGRKILEGVDAKRITVLDEDENVLFNADADTDTVQIAGFTVEDDEILYVEETASGVVPGQNDSDTVAISNSHILTSSTIWDDLGSGPFSYDKSSEMSKGQLELVVDTQNDPDGGKYSVTHIFGGEAQLAVEKGGYESVTPGGTRQSILIEPEMPHSLQIEKTTIDSGHNYVSNYVWLGSDDIKLHTDNPDRTLTITASGPTPTPGHAQVSVPTGTAYHTVTNFDLDPGTYLVQIHFAFATNTSGRRVGIVSYSQNSSAQISAAWRASAAPVNGENTFLNICGIIKPNSTTTFYLNAMQNSGSGLNTFASYNYVRLA